MRLHNAFADREPQATSTRSARPERIEDAIQVGRRNRRSVVLHPGLQEGLAWDGTEHDATRRRRPLQRVFQQVGEDTADLKLVYLNRWQVLGEHQSDLMSLQVRPQLMERGSDELRESMRLLVQLEACFETREGEHVSDEPVETGGLA